MLNQPPQKTYDYSSLTISGYSSHVTRGNNFVSKVIPVIPKHSVKRKRAFQPLRLALSSFTSFSKTETTQDRPNNIENEKTASQQRGGSFSPQFVRRWAVN